MNIILFLSEEDLIEENSVKIENVTIDSFKSSISKECRRSDLVVYTNDLGESKLMKSRFGSLRRSPVDAVIDSAKLFMESE